MTDELISRTVVLAECQRVSDEAKGYGIPQMTMGAHACQESIRALPAVQPQVGLDPREVAEWFDGIAKPTAAQSPRHMAANYRDRILADLTPTPVDASPTRNSGEKMAEALALVKCLQREPALIWIIENTTQVRIRDLALDMLDQQRTALAALEARHE